MRMLPRIRNCRERTLVLVAVALLGLALSTVSCGRQKPPTTQVAVPTPIPLSLEVRVTRSRDGFRSHEFIMLEHRFATNSGSRATYDSAGLHLTVQPTSNGDRTITTWASFSDEKAGSATESFSMTSVDGQSMTHQIGDVRIVFGVTIDPGRMAIMNATESPTTFVEGDYSWPSGQDFQFLLGQFIDCNLPATRGQSSAQRIGPYRVDGENIIVRFDGMKVSQTVFYHRVIEGVHLLLDGAALPYVDVQRSLPANDSYGVYILRPEGGKRSPGWWQELLGTHPKLAEIFLHYRDAKQSWRGLGPYPDGGIGCVSF